MASAESCRTIAGEPWPGLSGASPRRRIIEKGNQDAGETTVEAAVTAARCISAAEDHGLYSELPSGRRLCKIALIPDEVAAQIPRIPDHEVLRVIGRGAYG